MPHERLLLGAMSGTSADGVDVALTHITGRGLEMQARLLTHAYHPYPPDLRKQILETRQRGDVRLSDLAEMGRQVTLAYVEACRLALKQANVSADQVAAVAAHGQTLFHGPPNTIQYFDPSLLAYETGIAVVSDFRRADLAAGGQGAPLVPFADWILFRHPTKSRVLLNIGGIANITYLKAGGSIDEVIAFDTGPGNCLSDWIVGASNLGNAIDEGGSLALSGTPDQTLAGSFAMRGFMRQKPPKSTDGPSMVTAFLEHASVSRAGHIEWSLRSVQDKLATASLAVTYSVLSALHHFISGWEQSLDELLVSGGGVQNAAIMQSLTDRVVDLTARAGRIPAEVSKLSFRHGAYPPDDEARASSLADAREALAFALLGAATLDGEPSNVPSATGANRRVVLGSITPKP